MKGHYIFSALLGIGLLLQGCETLDYTPADQLNDKTFWRTEQHANQAAVALYAAMKAGWAFGRDFTFDMISDIATVRLPMPELPGVPLFHPETLLSRTPGNISTK